MKIFKKIKLYIKNKIKNDEINNRILQALTFSFIGSGLSKASILLASILFSRILGRELYGQYSLVNNTINTFVTFASVGVGSTIYRYSSIYRDQNKSKCGHYIGSLTLICSIVSSLISILVVLYSNEISNWISKDVNISSYIKIASIIIFLISVGTMFQNILLGFEKYKNIAVNDVVYGILELIIGCFLSIKFGILGAIFALLIARTIYLLSMFVSSKKIIAKEQISITYKLDKNILFAFKSMALPSFFAGLLVMPVSWYLNVRLVQVAGYGDLAVYSVSAQWVTIITYITSQFNRVKPIYTNLIARKDYSKFKRVLKKMVLISSLIGGGLAVICAIFSDVIMSFYGTTYIEYVNVFRIMMIATFFITIQSQLVSVFEASGHMWLGFLLNLIWAFNIIVLFFFFDKYGVFGYSCSYMLSYVIHSILSWICVVKLINNEKYSM